MTMLRSIPAVWLCGALLTAAATNANAQAPEPKGPVAKPLLNLDLAPEIDSVHDRVMRMQLTTYEPGASNKPHSHKDRPEVVYILSL
jgi:quercetin dioxygenase-like cupin family protein